ncbi:MAG: MmgE/PrpD family protein [Spirochaetota bacterium]|nr:MmgE/PrpD family protein [Spirochaetota bacterium]
MEYTKMLSDFCAKLTYNDIPEQVIHKAKLCLLDYIANVYGSLEIEAVKHTIDFIMSITGKNISTILGIKKKTDLLSAAFVNGTTAEAIEAQDGLRFGGNHPVCAVMPAALTVGEKYKKDGKSILTAIIAGYEVANRAAASVHPFHTLSGFLPTGTCGTFGAATTAGKLMQLDEKGMLNAIGNAGYVVPLSMAEHLMGGYTIKIVQGGQAASAGIMAAGLAAHGITGFPKVFEGSELKGGFTQITSKAEPKPERLIDKLGEHFTIMDIYIKPYTGCRHTHGAVQGTLGLIQENNVKPDDVDSILVETYGIAELAVGKHITTNSSFVAAQFSIPYTVSACIFDGDLGPAQITEKRISDSTLIEFSKKVTVKAADDLNAMYPDKTASRVTIKMNNGQIIQKQVDIPKGDPRDPMNVEDIKQKIKRFAKHRKVNADALAEMVMNIEKIKNINELIKII